MTGFPRDLRTRLWQGTEKTAQPGPVLARIPATSLLSNLAAGFDLAAWLREDLVEGTMLSPLVFCPQAPKPLYADHVQLAHRYGTICAGGLGSLELIRNHVPKNTEFFRPEPMCRLLEHQYAAGVDAMSVYQTGTLARMDYLRDHMRLLANREAVRARAAQGRNEQVSAWLGYDWHTSREGRFRGYELASPSDYAL